MTKYVREGFQQESSYLYSPPLETNGFPARLTNKRNCELQRAHFYDNPRILPRSSAAAPQRTSNDGIEGDGSSQEFEQDGISLPGYKTAYSYKSVEFSVLSAVTTLYQFDICHNHLHHAINYLSVFASFWIRCRCSTYTPILHSMHESRWHTIHEPVPRE